MSTVKEKTAQNDPLWNVAYLAWQKGLSKEDKEARLIAAAEEAARSLSLEEIHELEERYRKMWNEAIKCRSPRPCGSSGDVMPPLLFRLMQRLRREKEPNRAQVPVPELA